MKSTTNLNFLLRYWRLVRPGFRANLLLALWLSASTGSVLAQAVTANGNPAPPLPGASFEAPEVKDCSQTVAPQSWTGQGDIHVLAQQSNCLPLWVPDGKQAVGLEPGASISQTTAWQPGKYQLQFQVALGLDPLVNWFIPPAMTLTVKVGGATVASQVVSSGAFVQVTTAPFTVSSANPVLELSSSCCLPPGSQTSLVGSSHPFTIAIVLDDLSVGSLPVWSNPNSWIGNAVPGLTDSVLIPSSVALELDQSDTVRTIKVEGTLTVAQDRDITLGTDYLWVHGAGALFQWGTETNPYEHQGRLHLMASATDVLPSEIEDFGTNFVGATMGGTLEIHGADRDVAWTFLDATAQENALTITLVEPTDWQVGETLVIASTDYDLDQAEERTITAVSADSTVFTLDAPLDNMHFGEIQTYDHGDTTYYLDTRAEVALLSRNLVILGAEPGPEGFGGQTFIRHGGQGRMSGVQLHHMGQKSELGRYPFHWHHAHDATNQYIKNSTVTYSFNRAVTVHRTMNALIEDVVAHEHIGHGFFLEDATETGNVFNHNLGLGTRAPEEGEEVQLHDRKEEAINGIKLLMLPATFWITNPENTFTNNSSAGSEGSGFWMTAQQGIISGDPIPGFIPPAHRNLVGFTGNRGHSNPFSNFAIDGQAKIVAGTAKEDLFFGHYAPQNSGNPLVPIVTDFTSYKCRDRGLWMRANTMIFEKCHLADNHKATFFAFNQTLRQSLIVGWSANVGNPSTDAEEQALGRTLPRPWITQSKHVRNRSFGHILYDVSSTLDRVHFAGFPSPDQEWTFALGHSGAANKVPIHRSSGLTFDSGIPEHGKVTFFGASHFDNVFAGGLLDLDGSLTGTAMRRIAPLVQYNSGGRNLPLAVRDLLFNTEEGDSLRTDWNAGVTSNLDLGGIRLVSFWADTVWGPVYFTRYTDVPGIFNKTGYSTLGDNPANFLVHQPSVFTGSDHMYLWQYHQLPTRVHLNFRFTHQNARLISAIPNVPSDLTIRYLDGAAMTQAANLQDLRTNPQETYFLKDNILYIHHLADRGGTDPRYGDAYSYYSDTVLLCLDASCTPALGNTDGVVLADFEDEAYSNFLFQQISTTGGSVCASADGDPGCPPLNNDHYVKLEAVNDVPHDDGFAQYNMGLYDLPWTQYDTVRVTLDSDVQVTFLIRDRENGMTVLGTAGPTQGVTEFKFRLDHVTQAKRDKVYRFVTRINKSALPHNATGTVRLYKVELMSTPILRNPPPPTQSRGALAGITSGAEPLTLPTGPQVALYPNPTEGTFTLASSGKGAVNLRIFSALGQSVYHQTITPQHDQWQITLSAEELGLRPGMYQVWWQQGDYRKSLPLMIR